MDLRNKLNSLKEKDIKKECSENSNSTSHSYRRDNNKDRDRRDDRYRGKSDRDYDRDRKSDRESRDYDRDRNRERERDRERERERDRRSNRKNERRDDRRDRREEDSYDKYEANRKERSNRETDRPSSRIEAAPVNYQSEGTGEPVMEHENFSITIAQNQDNSKVQTIFPPQPKQEYRKAQREFIPYHNNDGIENSINYKKFRNPETKEIEGGFHTRVSGNFERPMDARQFSLGCNLVCKNIAIEITHEDIQEIFGVYGVITSMKLLKNPGGDCYMLMIAFATPEQAKAAMQNLNGYDKSFNAFGRKWKIDLNRKDKRDLIRQQMEKDISSNQANFSRDNRKRKHFGIEGGNILDELEGYIEGYDKLDLISDKSKAGQCGPIGANICARNINPNLPKENISTAFERFGALMQLHIMSSKQGHCLALLSFASPLEAQKARLEMHGTTDIAAPGRQLMVDYTIEDKKKMEVKGPPGANLRIQNLPRDFDDTKLYKLFADFGAILCSKVVSQKHPTNPNMARLTGYISYDNVESAISAMTSRHNSILAGSQSNHQGYQLPLDVSLIKIDNAARHWTQINPNLEGNVDFEDPTTDNYIYNNFVIEGLETDSIHYIDGNFNFRQDFCEKLEAAYNSTTHSTWLLPLEIIYRSNDDQIISRFVNSGLLRANCHTFFIDAEHDEEIIKAYALPLELDTTSIESILGWIHGKEIIIPEDLDSQMKLLIAAYYFQCPEIIFYIQKTSRLKETRRKGYQNESVSRETIFLELNEFADNLPRPMVVYQDMKVETVEDLPRFRNQEEEKAFISSQQQQKSLLVQENQMEETTVEPAVNETIPDQIIVQPPELAGMTDESAINPDALKNLANIDANLLSSALQNIGSINQM